MEATLLCKMSTSDGKSQVLLAAAVPPEGSETRQRTETASLTPPGLSGCPLRCLA